MNRMSELHADREALIHFTTEGERIYRTFEGKKHWEFQPELMLAQLRGSAAAGDWWSPYAQVMADQLAECIEHVRKREAA